MTPTDVLTPADVSRAVTRASVAVACATGVTGRSRAMVSRSRSRRLRTLGPGSESLRYFTLQGELEAQPVRARWFRGTLRASPALLSRAELLAEMGERVAGSPGAATTACDLGSPTAALLTLIRACDRVSAVCLGPLPTAPPVRRRARGEER